MCRWLSALLISNFIINSCHFVFYWCARIQITVRNHTKLFVIVFKISSRESRECRVHVLYASDLGFIPVNSNDP